MMLSKSSLVLALIIAGYTNALAAPKPPTRRQVFAGWLGVGTAAALVISNQQKAEASCIAGDRSLDCIGSYKEKIPKARPDTEALTIKQKALLKVMREDTTVTNPSTIQDALGILHDQQIALEAIEDHVEAGQLQEAGVLLLAAMPKVAVAGRYVASQVSSAASRFVQTALARAEQDSKELDKTIMLGMKGHKGAIAAAQLAVMADLVDVKESLKELIDVAKAGAAIPKV